MNRALFSPLNLGLFAALLLATAAGYAMIAPGALLPIHWGVTGAPDAFLPRDGALLVAPAITVAISLVFYALGRLAPPAQIEASKHAWRTVVPALTALLLAIQAGVVLIGLGYPDVMVRIISVVVAIMLILFGNVMPKMQPNTLAGIRLPWLQDPAVWRATQRLGGVLFMAGGAALLAFALVVNDPLQLIVLLLVSLAVPLVATTIYSYRLVRRL